MKYSYQVTIYGDDKHTLHNIPIEHPDDRYAYGDEIEHALVHAGLFDSDYHELRYSMDGSGVWDMQITQDGGYLGHVSTYENVEEIAQ